MHSAHRILKSIQDTYRAAQKLSRREGERKLFSVFQDLSERIEHELREREPIQLKLATELSAEDELLQMLAERAERRRAGKPVEKLNLLVKAA